MIVLSISKSKALASLRSKKISAACLSSNAVLPSQPQAFQLLRDQFWADFAARQQVKSGPDMKIDISPSLSASESNGADDRPPRYDVKEINETSLRQRHLARTDLFKHAHMKASSRFMKHGDALSREYSLGIKADIPYSQSSKQELTDTSYLVDIAAAKSHREKMHHTFWEAHERRKVKVASQASKEEMSPRLSLSFKSTELPLPSTLSEAYLEFASQPKAENKQPRAMVITEAQPPFNIVEVNNEWVDLCGYSRKQAVGSTLKALLQGPETDLEAAKNLVSALIGGRENEAVLTNYRRDGNKFRSHVRVGPIRNAGVTTYFVGVFVKMSDDLNYAPDETLVHV